MLRLHPATVKALDTLTRLARRRGIRFTVTSGFRSVDSQAELYRRWQLGDPRIYKPALPGMSTHNYGLAVDLDSPQRASLKALAAAAGFFTIPGDPVHYQVVSPSWWASLFR